MRVVVAIPSYNTGAALLIHTVRDALAHAAAADIDCIHVIIDGSTDDSVAAIREFASQEPRLRLTIKSTNSGKGDSLRQLALTAAKDGYTHMLTMDADGQHPGHAIADLLAAARKNPQALIMGQPQFGSDVPKARLYGRRLTLFWTDLETLWCGLGDTLFGMRVYPIAAFNHAFAQTAFARGFDFDPEIAVRMVWLGLRPVGVPVPVRYLKPEQGGVSHFHYLRDNIKLTLLHFRLIPEWLLLRLPCKLWRAASVPAIAIILLCLLTGSSVANADGNTMASNPTSALLDLLAPPPAWQELFDILRIEQSMTAAFTEWRRNPFHRAPRRFRGELFWDPQHGFSLHYFEPTPMVIWISPNDIVVLRGRSAQRMDLGGEHQELMELFGRIFRWDMAWLDQRFAFAGDWQNGNQWQLQLSRRDGQLAALPAVITLRGVAGALQSLNFSLSGGRSVDMRMETPHFHPAFDTETLNRAFPDHDAE